MGKVIPFLAIVLLAGSVGAQDLGGIGSLEEIRPPADTHAPVASSPPAAVKPPDSPEPTSTSAHYALADVDAYIAKMAQRLSIRNRLKDPFGMSLDPAAEVASPVAATSQPVVQTVPKLPFADIINSIRVTAIMPAEKRFLVGSRVIREGDTLPLAIQNETVIVRVLAVRSNEILFENTGDKTTATLRAGFMPSGMSRSGGGDIVPGMQPTSPNAPLPLDFQISPPPR